MDEEQPRPEGYFTNDDEDYYGPKRKEYLHITQNDGHWQGVKIVGDANVPRGKVAFKTENKVEDIEEWSPAKNHFRLENEGGYTWKYGRFVRFDYSSDKWFIRRMGEDYSFSRVDKMEADNAEKQPDHGISKNTTYTVSQ